MTQFFQHAKGGFIYVGGFDVEIPTVRFVLAYYGEDAEKVIEQFWQEHRGDFCIVPLFAYGAVPRRELCSQRSLVAALQTVTIEPGGMIERKWKQLCEQMNVAWPTRLQGKAA